MLYSATVAIDADKKPAIEAYLAQRQTTLDQFLTETLAQALREILSVVNSQDAAQRSRAFGNLSPVEQQQALISR